MSIFKEPLLICEAGLHADGDVEYYLEMVRSIQEWWVGWPRIAFKVQIYTVPSDLRVMRSLELEDVSCRLTPAVHKAGMLMAVTPHDVASTAVARAWREPLDILKLGSFGAADTEMREAAYRTGLPLIMSGGVVATETLVGETQRKAQDEVSFLQCVSAYPANVAWNSARDGGYSCHCVPRLAVMESRKAAQMGCRLIEVHVTNRPANARPQPKDYCVSLPMDQFRMLVEDLGAIWSAEPMVPTK